MSQVNITYHIHKLKIKLATREHFHAFGLLLVYLIENRNIGPVAKQLLQEVFNEVSKRTNSGNNFKQITIKYANAFHVMDCIADYPDPNSYSRAIGNQVKDDLHRQIINITV